MIWRLAYIFSRICRDAFVNSLSEKFDWLLWLTAATILARILELCHQYVYQLALVPNFQGRNFYCENPHNEHWGEPSFALMLLPLIAAARMVLVS